MQSLVKRYHNIAKILLVKIHELTEDGGKGWLLKAEDLTKWEQEEEEDEDEVQSNEEDPHSAVSQESEK